jgi:molybdate transport system substrate-binding protein
MLDTADLPSVSDHDDTDSKACTDQSSFSLRRAAIQEVHNSRAQYRRSAVSLRLMFRTERHGECRLCVMSALGASCAITRFRQTRRLCGRARLRGELARNLGLSGFFNGPSSEILQLVLILLLIGRGTGKALGPASDGVRKRSTMMGIRTFSMAMVIAGGLTGVIATGERVQAESLTVAAAHSLKGAFHEIVPMFEKEYGATVRVVYGPSQTLRRQVEKGAEIDVFLSTVEEIEKLQKKGLTLNGGPRVYAQTSLVLVMSATSHAIPISFHDVLSNRGTRIALGDHETSAVGVITARALRKIDPVYRDRFRLVHAQHNEEIVDLVYAGEADVGIVYRVDAIRNSRQVRIVDDTPAGAYTPVQLGEAVVWTCRDAARHVAEEFFDFIASPRIQKLLLKYGFDPVPPNG